MKKKWYSYFDNVKFALTLLFVGQILIGIGNLPSEQETIANILTTMKYCGGLIKSLFPLAVVVNCVGERNKDGISVIGAIISYIILEVCTMLFAKTTYPNFCYNSFLSLNMTLLQQSSTVIRQPLNLGLIASAVVVFIINETYDASRKRFNYGFLSFIGNDAWFFILSIPFTVLFGAVLTYGYGLFESVLVSLMESITDNSTNPAAMFVFGATSETLKLLGLSDLINQNFWMGTMGGTWTSSGGTVYIGDIAIWTAQYANNIIGNTSGKYVTYMYVLNLFAVPASILAYWINFDNKIERTKYSGLMILGIVTSMVGAAEYPMLMTVAFTSPAVTFFLIAFTGLACLFCSMFSITLGYNYSGELAYALPGSIVDYIKYLGSVDYHIAALKLLIVGIVTFVVVFLFIKLYYRYLSQDFLEPAEKKTECQRVISAMGGVGNIKMATSALNSLTVVLNQKNKLNMDALLAGRVYKIEEKYFGYIIHYGPGSHELCRMINAEINDYISCKEFTPTEGKTNG